MRALDRKLLRDLARMPGQGLTIALIVALGIASYVGSLSTYRSLVRSRDAYYASSRFADVFARVVRAPRFVLGRLEAIPGVAQVEGRVVETLRVEVEGFGEPASGVFTSTGPGGLNALYLREGRPLARDDEVLVGEQFARAHGLRPGGQLTAVINGRRTRLRIAGIALSPEHVWVLQPGAFWTDELRTGVFWMRRKALATALGLEDAFNSVALALAPGASAAGVIEAVDRVLEPYGSFGAHGRDQQPSNRLVEDELGQLQVMATLLPLIFLGVAAFLVNLVLSRVVANQREQIASLKALGYWNRQVAVHYALLALAIVMAGAIPGVGLGALMGQAFVDLYTRYFRFPSLPYHLDPALALTAVGVSLAAGVLGALAAVARVARLAPAEAMRPEAPMAYRRTWLEQLRPARRLPVVARMVLRDLLRRPVRLLLSSLGIALATSVMVTGNAAMEALTHLFEVQFDRVQREDLEVGFARPVGAGVRRSIAGLPGVHRAEWERRAPVRIRAGHRSRELLLRGVPEDGQLRLLLDRRGEPRALPPGGIALSAALGRILEVGVGDEVDVELLQGSRPRRAVPVTAFIDDALGLSAYMESGALDRFLGEPGLADAALLAVDPGALGGVERRLMALPGVSGFARPERARALFKRQITDVLLTYQTVLALCAAAIAVGVVYNNARIALSARGRDLATLRILGFRRSEVAGVLAGEQVVQLALGIPAGLWLGAVIAEALYSRMDPELYRITVTPTAHTRALAAAVIVAAGALSALVIRRGVRKMDLVAVLKARD